MKPVKIIEISGFRKNKAINHPPFGSDSYFISSWAGLFARRLKNKFNELDIECWRVDSEVTSIQERMVLGVRGVLFPYRFPLITNVITIDMYKRLCNLQKHYMLVIHYTVIFDYFGIFAPFLLRQSKIILSHLGGNPPPKDTMKGRIKYILFQVSYPRLYAITYIRKQVKDYLSSINNVNLFFLPVGADFNEMKPQPKLEARQRLGLDPEKVYAVYVGKYFTLKGVDKIIEGYKRYSGKYNFSIILTGGSKDEKNDLFDEVVSSGCAFFGPQPYEPGIMAVFYSAADFYIHPAFNAKFGGLDVSWMEALACNIPVLSPQLCELENDWKDLGIAVENELDFYEKLEWMINNYKQFKNCRQLARQYLDGNDAIIVKLMKIIDGKNILSNRKQRH